MTVGEIIDALTQYDRDMNVYVPCFDGTTQIAKRVEEFPHLNTPAGITILNDVWILPWAEEEEPS